jgi:hypothetical protein
LGRRLEYTDNPRTTAVDRRSTPSVMGGPTSTSADASVPRLAGFSLITLITCGQRERSKSGPAESERSEAKRGERMNGCARSRSSGRSTRAHSELLAA